MTSRTPAERRQRMLALPPLGEGDARAIEAFPEGTTWEIGHTDDLVVPFVEGGRTSGPAAPSSSFTEPFIRIGQYPIDPAE